MVKVAPLPVVRRVISGLSGEGEEQPLQPISVERGVLAGRLGGQALLQPAGDELEAGAVSARETAAS